MLTPKTWPRLRELDFTQEKPMSLSLAEFVERWKAVNLTERSAGQSHFIDLCEILGQPHPAAADPNGDTFTFEKHVSTLLGGKGFADVWRRGFFAWEYKGKHKDLGAAYKQLADYREDLQNPPLLVVCDMDIFEVHTNFTGTRPNVYHFTWTICSRVRRRPIARSRRLRFSAHSSRTLKSFVRRPLPLALPNRPPQNSQSSPQACERAEWTRNALRTF